METLPLCTLCLIWIFTCLAFCAILLLFFLPKAEPEDMSWTAILTFLISTLLVVQVTWAIAAEGQGEHQNSVPHSHLKLLFKVIYIQQVSNDTIDSFIVPHSQRGSVDGRQCTTMGLGLLVSAWRSWIPLSGTCCCILVRTMYCSWDRIDSRIVAHMSSAFRSVGPQGLRSLWQPTSVIHRY